MAVDLDPAAEAAEFSALVNELEADAPEEAEEPEEVEETEELEEEPEEEELEEEPSELSAEESAARDLFEAGDVKGACKKLGIDPKILKIDARQFTAMRVGLKKAAELQKQGLSAKQHGEALTTKAEQVYGPIVAGYQAYKAGDPMKLRAAVELMCEDTFENVVATVARAAKGLDPAQVEVMKLRKEMADRDKAAAEAQKAAGAVAQEKAEVAKLETQLKATPLAGISGAAKQIYQLVRDSFDGVGYALSVKDAYQQVRAEHAKIAASFGKKAPVRAKDPRAPLVPIRKLDAKLSPAERKAQREELEREEFLAVVKAAKDDEKTASRKVRRRV